MRTTTKQASKGKGVVPHKVPKTRPLTLDELASALSPEQRSLVAEMVACARQLVAARAAVDEVAARRDELLSVGEQLGVPRRLIAQAFGLTEDGLFKMRRRARAKAG